MQAAAIEKNVDICATSDLIENAGIAALVNETQIAIFYLKRTEQLYAVSNFDPFSQANVISRGIIGSIGDAIVVASPIYKQHFNLETGQCIEDESVSLTHYPVQIEGDRVVVSLC